MVQVMVELTEQANRTVEIIKATYGMNSKSDVIDMIIEKYGEKTLEPQLRPEYIEKIRKIKAGKFITVKDINKYFDEL
ncbi:MAG: DUF2683 family protein [DPANN group archaeon]|nr:DUF2683 family protein [DPANN group archaeon]